MRRNHQTKIQFVRAHIRREMAARIDDPQAKELMQILIDVLPDAFILSTEYMTRDDLDMAFNTEIQTHMQQVVDIYNQRHSGDGSTL